MIHKIACFVVLLMRFNNILGMDHVLDDLLDRGVSTLKRETTNFIKKELTKAFTIDDDETSLSVCLEPNSSSEVNIDLLSALVDSQAQLIATINEQNEELFRMLQQTQNKEICEDRQDFMKQLRISKMAIQRDVFPVTDDG